MNKIKIHRENFFRVIEKAEFTHRGITLGIEEWVGRVFTVFAGIKKQCSNVFFIGNGASCSIASHFAMDFTKNTGIRCFSNNDGALLTCYGNDFSFENAYLEMMKRYMRNGDCLIPISSSGRSKNIVNASTFVRNNYPDSEVIAFSGFAADNPLRALGTLELYLPVSDYGLVESGHSYFIHMLLDLLVESGGNGAEHFV